LTEQQHEIPQPVDGRRVIVIIPVKNASKELARTLESVREDPDLVDILVVDDGSAIPVEVDGDAHPVRVTRFDQSRGIAAALNHGISIGRSLGYRYIARLDAGDFAEPNRFARQRDYLDTHPEVLMVTSYVDYIDDDGDLLFTMRPPVDPEAIARDLKLTNRLTHPAVMFQARAFDLAGLYSTDYPLAEDYDLFRRIAAVGPIHTIPEVLTRYTISIRSVSTLRRRQLYHRIKIQLRYFAPGCLTSYIGVLQSFLSLAIPRSIMVPIQKILYGRAR